MTPHDDPARSISIVRLFDAPRALVFRTWVRAEDLGAWFAPEGFSVTDCEVDPRPGGRWHVHYRSAEGELFRESGEFREVVEPERLVFTLLQQPPDGYLGADTLVTVAFAERGAKTEMAFLQTGFDSAALRDGVAEGWQGCFGKLDERLSANARP
ncbi:SRPBCC domain-containing protein [Sphaerisporangium sp. TRM90804]|uniref:SRPBCC family protein n=1 Tax=Sphaerisporangium sp. TRM90804 TaxID=3031113 RepID=UPI00244B973F|nr:SRPBCC domain-containing protein [Sphaerisporangium sp. TRM90804]MDH2425351.1 SRPBCC domain-containing protein [Sphaerisporangium sp. TRM90804]